MIATVIEEPAAGFTSQCTYLATTYIITITTNISIQDKLYYLYICSNINITLTAKFLLKYGNMW